MRRKRIAISIEKEQRQWILMPLYVLTQMSAGMMMQALIGMETVWGIENREGLYRAFADFIVLKPPCVNKKEDASEAPLFLLF